MTAEEQQHKDRETILAFKAVFGTGAKRSVAQKIVWAELIEKNLEQPVFIAGKSGVYDPLAAALNDGGRRVLQQIKSLVNRDTTEKPEKKKAKKQQLPILDTLSSSNPQHLFKVSLVPQLPLLIATPPLTPWKLNL